MIENIINDIYYDYLDSFNAYENKSSIIISKIIIKKQFRSSGIGSKIMQTIVDYADDYKQIVVLTPSADFGGDKNRLIQFYKRFGFKHNQGIYKNDEFSDSMIRYPRNKTYENYKLLVRKFLNETLLKETIMQNNKIDVKKIADFVNFAKKCLNIDDDIKIALAFKRTPELTTTAYYDHSKGGFIKVYVKDRAIIDICRSIAHELVHHQQFLQDRLTGTMKDGADGSDIENEANAVAGVIIRKWGKLHKEIYI